MKQKSFYPTFMIFCIVAIYAAVIASWEFFRPVNHKDIGPAQFQMLRQQDQSVDTKSRVTFETLSVSQLRLNTTTGNRLLGINEQMEIVPVDLKIDVKDELLSWSTIKLSNALHIGEPNPFDLAAEPHPDTPLMTLHTDHRFRTTSMFTMTSASQDATNIENSSFWQCKLKEQELPLAEFNTHGTLILQNFEDEQLVKLVSNASGRMKPHLQIIQNDSMSPFFTCQLYDRPVFSVQGNGDLLFDHDWALTNTNDYFTMTHDYNPYIQWRSNNADVKLFGDIQFGDTRRSESNLYFNQSNDSAICASSNELLLFTSRNTSDHIRFRSPSFLFQTSAGTENMSNQQNNNTRFTLNNTSANLFNNSLVVDNDQVNMKSNVLRVTFDTVNVLNNDFVVTPGHSNLVHGTVDIFQDNVQILDDALVVYNDTTISTKRIKSFTDTIDITPQAVRFVSNRLVVDQTATYLSSYNSSNVQSNELIVDTNGIRIPKNLFVQGGTLPIPKPSYININLYGWAQGAWSVVPTGNNLERPWLWNLDASNVANVNDNEGVGDILRNAGIFVTNDNNWSTGYQTTNCIKFVTSGIHFISFTLSVYGVDQRILFRIRKTTTTPSNGAQATVSVLSRQYVDIGADAQTVTLSAVGEFLINETVVVTYQAVPKTPGGTDYGGGDTLRWQTASLIAYSV